MDEQEKAFENELEARRKALDQRERELEEREKRLGPFSQAMKAKKESLYDKVKLTKRQMDWIVWILWTLLGIVVVLIVLEAAGIFKL